MAEPMTISGFLAAKYVALLGGFLGAIASLSFIAELGMLARVNAVITGMAVSYFAVPAVAEYWQLGQNMQGLAAFVLGLTSLHLVPATINAARWIRCNAGTLLAKRFGIEEERD